MRKLDNLGILLDYIEQGLRLTIYPKRGNSLFEEDESAAVNSSEARYKLLEGHFYEYEFSDPRFSFYSEKFVDPFTGSRSRGRIVPNIYVGTITLSVFREDVDTGEKVELEVLPVKAGYREDYRFMLESIAEKCTDLVMRAGSPVQQSFTIDPETDSQTLYQRFAFLQSIILSEDFGEAVQRILALPATGWTGEQEKVDIRKIKNLKKREVTEMLHSVNRFPLPGHHYLAARGLRSAAMHISSQKKKETYDIPENRFIKFALELFLNFSYRIRNHINANERLQREATLVINTLENYLSSDFFRELSLPVFLKLNSPVLQRKEGYREIFRIWLMFDLAARLIWEGGEDVYRGGKKDIATLYEYWLFFELLETFSRIFRLEPGDLEKLIQKTDESLEINLRQGRHVALQGIYERRGRNLKVRFSYNRTFSRAGNSYPEPGSWTVSMRPDYTLSVWPQELSEQEAERKELIVHIHFDAKYKVENIVDLFKDADTDDPDYYKKEKEENRQDVYKRGDLLKMHAYKDAIRRTEGAYILYPGDQDMVMKGFHEIIPGLGAFPVKPKKDGNSGINYLQEFVEEVMDHFQNRISQREKMAVKRYEIHKSGKPDVFKEPAPEFLDDLQEQKLIPDEVFVLIGYYKSEAHLAWIKRKMLYNFRIGDDRGGLVLDGEMADARYLLLHTEDDREACKIFRIVSKGPRIFSKKEMLRRDYPDPQHDFYLVIDIENVDGMLAEYCWDFRKLRNYRGGQLSAFPFTVSLKELMLHKL